MKNKKIGALLMLPMLASMLAGCGGGGGSGDTIKIKWWHTFGQTIVDNLKEKINNFKAVVSEHDNVSVDVELTYQGSYDDIAKKINDGYGVNNKPTIAVAYPDNVADYLEVGKSANDDFVVNLEKFIKDDNVGFGKEAWLGDENDESDFVAEFFKEGSQYAVEGTYSLPYMKSTEIMFYNMKLLKKTMKGVHVGDPSKDFDGYDETIGASEAKIIEFMAHISWDKFMELCGFIKSNMEKISNVLEVPAIYDSDGNMFISKLFQNRIGYCSIDQNGKGQIDFESGENKTKTVAMLEKFNEQFNKGLFTTKGILGTYGSDYFTGEKSMFSIGSSGGSGYNFPQADAFTLGVCRVPDSANNPLYVSQGPTLAIFSDNSVSKEQNDRTQLYAWKLIKYLTNGQVNAELCVRGSEGYVPVRYSAYETPYFQEFIEAGENYAKCAKVVLDEININCGYLVSPAFKGSAALRDESATLLTAALRAKATNKSLAEVLGDIIAERCAAAKLKF